MSYKLFVDSTYLPPKVAKFLVNWRNRKVLGTEPWLVVTNHADFGKIVDVLGKPAIISFGDNIDSKKCLEHLHDMKCNIIVHCPNIFNRIIIKKLCQKHQQGLV